MRGEIRLNLVDVVRDIDKWTGGRGRFIADKGALGVQEYTDEELSEYFVRSEIEDIYSISKVMGSDKTVENPVLRVALQEGLTSAIGLSGERSREMLMNVYKSTQELKKAELLKELYGDQIPFEFDKEKYIDSVVANLDKVLTRIFFESYYDPIKEYQGAINSSLFHLGRNNE